MNKKSSFLFGAMALFGMNSLPRVNNEEKFRKIHNGELLNGSRDNIIIPAGTKEYFFDINGNYVNSHMRREDCVFWCFASNDKNAKKKFNNWENKQKI